MYCFEKPRLVQSVFRSSLKIFHLSHRRGALIFLARYRAVNPPLYYNFLNNNNAGKSKPAHVEASRKNTHQSVPVVQTEVILFLAADRHPGPPEDSHQQQKNHTHSRISKLQWKKKRLTGRRARRGSSIHTRDSEQRLAFLLPERVMVARVEIQRRLGRDSYQELFSVPPRLGLRGFLYWYTSYERSQ